MSDPETIDADNLQQALVDKLVEDGSLTDTAVETAFRTVPRHLFLPDKPLDVVYRDEAIPTKRDDQGRAISSSSQPAIMAIMLEQLALRPGQSVLEIGAGTGYNAALMGHLVGKDGRVTTIDLDEDIVVGAQTHLTAAGCGNVTAVCGDGMDGYASNGPYDRIILTVGGWEIAPAWLAQLAPDGRLLLPLSLKGPQFSTAFEWQNGRLSSHSVRNCGFMRLRGPQAGPDKLIPIHPEKEIFIGFEEDQHQLRQINADQILAWLRARTKDIATGVTITQREAWGSLLLWLALHEPDLVSINASGQAVAEIGQAYIFGFNGMHPWRMTLGILHNMGLLALVHEPEQHSEKIADSDPGVPQLFELYFRQYGDGGTAVAKLSEHLHNWEKAGRPSSEDMTIDVYPRNTPIADGIAIPLRWHTFVVTYQQPPVE